MWVKGFSFFQLVAVKRRPKADLLLVLALRRNKGHALLL